MQTKILLIYGHTNHHLGLWNDLIEDSRVIMCTTEPRKLNILYRVFKRIYLKLSRITKRIPLKHLFFQYHSIFKITPHVQHLVIIDGALRTIDICELNKCRKINPKIKISLYLINSIDAQSPIMRGVRPKISQFRWDSIYTFDEEDAKKWGYTYLGFNYYSKHVLTSLPDSVSDVFFVGGLKGGRSELIFNLCKRFINYGIKCDFYLMPIDIKNPPQLPGIMYYHGWKPYEEVLQHTQQTKCIVEIMQEGQCGATLRYFEAVTMNKKLLTNNEHIVKFPFYNPKWMRIFKNVEDIDLEWLTKEENVNYGYTDEFSPKYFIDYLTSKQ